jgi:tetratricopeptide (TPR) repeat protein
LAPSTQTLPRQEGTRRIPLVNHVSLPKLTYLDFEGAARELSREEGPFLLVNLWASWCGPCRIELEELADHEAELREAGLDVLALSVDGLGDDRSDPERARALLSEIRFPFTSGRATQNLVQLFQALHNLHIRGRQAPLPVPSSFLVGPDGNLAAIYKGAVDIGDLIDDVKRKPGTLLERYERSAPFAGRVLKHDAILAALRSDETRIRFVFGTELQKAGLVDDAELQYRELLKADPEFSLAHYNLGFLYLRQDMFPEARRHLTQAVKLDPDHALAHKNLGRLYHMEGRPNEARAHYVQALRLQPIDPEPHYLLGIMAIAEGDLDQAKARLEDAVRIEPELVQAHNNLGIIYARNGDHETAKSHYRKALSLDPEFADAHINLGGVLMGEKKYQDAIAQYRQALRIEPNNGTARKNLQRAQSMNLNQ